MKITKVLLILLFHFISFYSFSQDSISFSNGQVLNFIDQSKSNKFSINIDDFKKKFGKDFVGIVVLKADTDGSNGKNPPKQFVVTAPYDTRVIKVIIYELKSTKRNDKFKFIINKDSEVIDSISPYAPFLMVISNNKKWIVDIKNEATLSYYKNDSTILTLPRIQTDFEVIQTYLNKILYSINDDFYAEKIRFDNFDTKIYDLKKSFDSVKNKNDISNLIGLQYNFYAFNGLFGLDKYDYYWKVKSNYSFSLNYDIYPFQKIRWLGAGIEINFSSSNISLSNKYNITDSNKSVHFDVDGNGFYRIAYASGIKENIGMQILSFTPHLSFKFPEKKEWFFTVNPGLKISSVLSSSYNATDGKISYGALYPEYNKKDTIFTGLYDNKQNVDVYNQKQKLKINNTLLAFNLSVHFQHIIYKNLLGSIGLFYEQGLTNMLKNEQQDKIISSGVDNYNSLLYRQENVKMNSFGINVGLSYKF